MFSKLQSFISRHRRKFIFGSVVISGAVLLSRYVQHVLRERQERETKELIERSQKRLHYESVERLCNQTALSMVPQLKERLVHLISAEKLVESLMAGTRNKIKAWEKLKVLSFTKATLLIYASSLLVVMLRVQFNVIGGYLYRDTRNQGKEVNSKMQENYMGLCHVFLERGLEKLRAVIEKSVGSIVKKKSLQEKMTVFDVERLLYSVQSSITAAKDDPCLIPADYIFPSELCWLTTEYAPCEFQVMNSLMNETRDILASSDAQSIVKSCVSMGFVFIVEELKNFFKAKVATQSKGGNSQNDPEVASTSSQSDASTASDTTNDPLNEVSIPLAKIIPIMNGLVQNHHSKSDVTQTWMETLILCSPLKTMGANVYETFSSS